MQHLVDKICGPELTMRIENISVDNRFAEPICLTEVKTKCYPFGNHSLDLTGL